MRYYVKYIKTPKKQAYVEKTKSFSSFENAISFARKHYTIEIFKYNADEQRQRWDEEMREWYPADALGWAL